MFRLRHAAKLKLHRSMQYSHPKLITVKERVLIVHSILRRSCRHLQAENVEGQFSRPVLSLPPRSWGPRTITDVF